MVVVAGRAVGCLDTPADRVVAVELALSNLDPQHISI
jgi:hypothetical protein